MNFSFAELDELRDLLVSKDYLRARDFISIKYSYALVDLAIKEDEEIRFVAVCSSLLAACTYTLFTGVDVYVLFHSIYITDLLNTALTVAKNILISFGILFALSQLVPLWSTLFTTLNEPQRNGLTRKLSTKVIIVTIVAMVLTVPLIMAF